MTTDYEELANNGMPAAQLAVTFLKEYFKDSEIIYPVNPFQILNDFGIVFLFRALKKYDGIYIPAEDENDFPIVGININRPIARQRFTAAHELCHHLKDLHNGGYVCSANSDAEIEKYAEEFASELLMPTFELQKQVQKYEQNGYIDFDGVLKVADYFGVSFQSCLFKIAYRLHKIKGDTSPDSLNKKAKNYKPTLKRKEFGMYESRLYEQVIDASSATLTFEPTSFQLEKFKINYIFHDSRLEGIDIDQETAAEIVTDLRLYKQESEYCKEENQNIVEVAGLTFVYDYIFEEANSQISIYDANNINQKLYSTAPCPDYGGKYRTIDTLVIGAKFETIPAENVRTEMFYLGKELDSFLNESNELTFSEYIKRVIMFHHRMTVIHPYGNGNGRTSRAFTNMLFIKRHIPPVFFRTNEKDEYKTALHIADTTQNYEPLYERYFKSILKSLAMFTDFNN